MASLPIIRVDPIDAESLIRFYRQTERDWVAHLAEPVEVRCGSAFANPSLEQLAAANCVLDAALISGQSPSEAIAQVTDAINSVGGHVLRWVMNSSVDRSQTQPLVDLLLKTGAQRRPVEVFSVKSRTVQRASQIDFQIIPARASFRHARQLADLRAAEMREPQLADASILHLDDPHFDALLALHENVAIASGGILTSGEIGRIDELFVHPDFRRRGVGAVMLNRLQEIAARSLLKFVLIGVSTENVLLKACVERSGFERIGIVDEYLFQS